MLAPAGHAERSRLAFRLTSVFQGSLYRPLTLGKEYLALTLPLDSLGLDRNQHDPMRGYRG